MRAKLLATTQDTPAALIAIGACSREDPHPKFFSATMMSPGFIFSMNSGLVESSMQCLASSFGSEVLRYRAGMIASVSTSAPNFQALPLNFIRTLKYWDANFRRRTQILIIESFVLS